MGKIQEKQMKNIEEINKASVKKILAKKKIPAFFAGDLIKIGVRIVMRSEDLSKIDNCNSRWDIIFFKKTAVKKIFRFLLRVRLYYQKSPNR